MVAAFEAVKAALQKLPDFPADIQISSAVNADDSVDAQMRVFIPLEMKDEKDVLQVIFSIGDMVLIFKLYKLYYTRIAGHTEFAAPDDPEGYKRRRGKYMVGTNYYTPKLNRDRYAIGWDFMFMKWRDIVTAILENEEGRRILFLSLRAYWSDISALPGVSHKRNP
jgi:hypothetical protein